MSYSYVKEDDRSYHLQHPDGSAFRVAKAGLHPDVVKKIDTMKPKNMADGGEVEEEESPFTQYATDQNSFYSGKDYAWTPYPEHLLPHHSAGLQLDAGMAPPDQADTDSVAVDRAPAGILPSRFSPPGVVDRDLQKQGFKVTYAKPGEKQDPDAPYRAVGPAKIEQGPAPASIPSGPNPMDLYNKGSSLAESGINDMAKAKQVEGQDTAKAYDGYVQQLQQQQALTNQHRDNILKEMDHIASSPIDPGRVWNNMSTGNKVLAGIGMALSGIGSGLSHQPNMALNIINKTIDQDIEAQKQNKSSLWHANMMKYKNEELADQATKLQLGAVLQGQIAKAAANSGSSQALATAKILKSQLLLNQQMPLVMQMANNRMMGQLYGSGAGSGGGGLPTNAIPAPILEKYGKQLVDVDGKSYMANSEKEAEDLNKMHALYRPIEDDINLIKKLGGSAAVPGTPENSRAHAAMNRLAMNVNEFNGYKRFTDTDKETIQKMFNDPTAVRSLLSGGATADTLKSLRTKMESARHTTLRGYRGTTSFNTKDYGE